MSGDGDGATDGRVLGLLGAMALATIGVLAVVDLVQDGELSPAILGLVTAALVPVALYLTVRRNGGT